MLSKDLEWTIFYRGIQEPLEINEHKKKVQNSFIAATEIQLSPYHNIYANVLEKSTSFIDKFCLAWKKNVFR